MLQSVGKFRLDSSRAKHYLYWANVTVVTCMSFCHTVVTSKLQLKVLLTLVLGRYQGLF